jgi:hypothetical protein
MCASPLPSAGLGGLAARAVRGHAAGNLLARIGGDEEIRRAVLPGEQHPVAQPFVGVAERAVTAPGAGAARQCLPDFWGAGHGGRLSCCHRLGLEGADVAAARGPRQFARVLRERRAAPARVGALAARAECGAGGEQADGPHGPAVRRERLQQRGSDDVVVGG